MRSDRGENRLRTNYPGLDVPLVVPAFQTAYLFENVFGPLAESTANGSAPILQDWLGACFECQWTSECSTGQTCDFGDSGGGRKLRFGNIQTGCCRAL